MKDQPPTSFRLLLVSCQENGSGEATIFGTCLPICPSNEQTFKLIIFDSVFIDPMMRCNGDDKLVQCNNL